MDAFYASVELLRYPELRGLPVVIGGHAQPPRVGRDGRRVFERMHNYAGRGVVTTSTYEARSLGVFSAMPMMRAALLAPDAVLLPVDAARYRDYSLRFKDAVAQVAPTIENRGVDEIYIDLTQHPESSLVLATRIKHAVHDATGLTCSIGIAANKLLAKIASDLDKPDGVTILTEDQIRTRVWPLPASTINGVGPKATVRLTDLGIHTIAELATADPARLQQHFGLSFARWLLDAANGRDNSPVVTSSEPKSMSRETTFARDLHVVHDRAELSSVFLRLCEQLEQDLIRKKYAARTVGLKLRFEDFTTVTRDLTVPDPVMRAPDIHQAAGQCLRRIELDRRIRLLGVRVSKLEAQSASGQRDGVAGQLSLDYI